MSRDSRLADWLAVGRRLAALFRDEQVSFLAAGIAYYAFVSLLPSLLLVLSVASLLGGEALAARLVDVTGDALSPVGQELIRDALVSADGRAPATVVGIALLLWSTLKVFRGLDVAFSRIYGTEPAASFLGRLRDAVVALGAVGAGLAALVAIGLFVSYSGVVLAGVVGTVGLVIVLAVAFFPLFYLFPDADESARAVLPGTLFAAVAWTLLGTLFRVYARVAGQFDVYGVLGVVLLLVTWYYVGGLALLSGAAINAIRGGRVAQTGSYNRHAADTTDTERA